MGPEFLAVWIGRKNIHRNFASPKPFLGKKLVDRGTYPPSSHWTVDVELTQIHDLLIRVIVVLLYCVNCVTKGGSLGIHKYVNVPLITPQPVSETVLIF